MSDIRFQVLTWFQFDRGELGFRSPIGIGIMELTYKLACHFVVAPNRMRGQVLEQLRSIIDEHFTEASTLLRVIVPHLSHRIVIRRGVVHGGLPIRHICPDVVL